MNCHMHAFYKPYEQCPGCAANALKLPKPTGIDAAWDKPVPGAPRLPLPPKPASGGKPALPTDSTERKRWPMFSALIRYFPAALAQVANHSFLCNEKHNPGLPVQHARGKSSDHEDCIVRHLVDAAEHPAGSPARIDELRALAWRTLALLQEECERAGHKIAPAATFTDKD